MEERPTGVTVSHEKFMRLNHALYNWVWGRPDPQSEQARWPTEQTYHEGIPEGELAPAVVVSLQPLLVACYDESFDAVMILQFEPWLAREYRLQVGSKLASAHHYVAAGEGTPAPDLVQGGNSYTESVDFQPKVLHFLSDDEAAIARAMARIADSEWQTCWEIGLRFVRENPGVYRPGPPFLQNQLTKPKHLKAFSIPRRERNQPPGWGPPLPQTAPVAVRTEPELDLPPEARDIRLPPYLGGAPE